MKYTDLLAKFQAGFVSEADLADVTAEDWMKVRLEAGDGILACTTNLDAMVETLAAHSDSSKQPKGTEGAPISYAMVSDALIPPFNDKVEAAGWDLKQFKYRGSPILWDHNMHETKPPIGVGSNVKKSVEMTRGGKSFKALTGDVHFVDRTISEFAGMIHDLVDAKLLTNGSVGFDIGKMRAPSKGEIEEQGMKPYSAVIQKASLFEFSVTPLGRDENAQRLANDGVDPLEAKLAEFAKAGVHSDGVIGEFREQLLQGRGTATRCSVTVPEFAANKLPEPEAETNVSNFTISNEMNPVTFADVTARTEITELRAELSKLREELALLTRSREEDLYELLLSDDAELDTSEVHSSHGSGELDDPLISAAIDLGF
tara:strand:+ start:31445 stop:32560 length:1116 start_codon:yes stop_codon:yes gene_type:complete